MSVRRCAGAPGAPVGPLVRRSWRRRPSRRGVSEIVATILLLAMTITLFASVFLFTQRVANAQPQPINQFAASLSYGGAGGLQVTAVSITHLSGTVLTGSSTTQTKITVFSQNHPSAIPSAFTIGSGLSGSSVWAFGQTWTVGLSAYSLTAPDNLTVSIISGNELQYRATLFALVPANSPYFTSVTLAPVTVAPGESYNLSTYVQFGSSSGDSVKVNLTEPGGSAAQALTGGGASRLYYYDGTAPRPGSETTYYLFLTAFDADGLKTRYAIALNVT